MTPKERQQLQNANLRERTATATAKRAGRKNLILKTKIQKLEEQIEQLQQQLEEAKKPKPKSRTRRSKTKTIPELTSADSK